MLVALIAAEGAASLPVPTFLSFGSYEAGGLAALTALGFPAGDSLVAMTAMHLLSQVVDYSLGGLAFLVFSWCAPGAPEKPDRKAKPIQHSAFSIQHFLPLVLSILFLFLSLLFAAWQARAIQKRGRLTAPPRGEAVEPTEAEAAACEAMLRAFGGRIVWSSNRSGSHDIWILDGPGAQPRRLTRSGFTDTYPRFSPDGTKVAFSRSTEPWVSQRNFDKWDTWVLDLATGEERLVATNAYQACWDPTAPVLYAVRAGGRQLVAVSADPAAPRESVVLESGVPPLGDGVCATLPDAHAGDPMFALTLRGAKNATVHVRLADGIKLSESTVREIAGGRDGVGAARQGADTFRHGGGDLSAGQAELLDGAGGDTQDLLLDGRRIGGDGAEIPGGRTGHGGQQMGDLSAGAGLGGAEGAAAIAQQPGYPVLDCFAHSWQTS